MDQREKWRAELEEAVFQLIRERSVKNVDGDALIDQGACMTGLLHVLATLIACSSPQKRQAFCEEFARALKQTVEQYAVAPRYHLLKPPAVRQ